MERTVCRSARYNLGERELSEMGQVTDHLSAATKILPKVTQSQQTTHTKKEFLPN